MSGFEGKVALITGAAHGQGRSHAVRLAQEGADVVIVDVCAQLPRVPYPTGTRAELDETAKLVEATGRRAVAMAADVRDPSAMAEAVALAEEEFGHLEIVVANAGINLSGQPTHELDDEAWSLVVDINLTGVFNTVRAAVPALLRSQMANKSIIMTSSAAALRPPIGIGQYNAAKLGVVGLMKTMAAELGPSGIRVNSVNPAAVGTDMIMNEAIMKNFVPESPAPTMEEFAERAQSMNALPIPWLEVVDVSNAVVWLASDEARYITGVALPVDPGVLVK
ncbi:NAD(P)-dependent oxidoreductase [Nocardioides immobilis]|uniref:NAD(P)-dependent oxidoreductase n=1 Tax=Nocardioides immobilis TaxID=2049295 RepID=A0A417Y118_9ACTN|nr:mycofactocin-coupled SDR family oxidoreductase [Nocardioides immobilis]RHW26281.1 NAD(P)-dependent oxidoreductase [Nocardioides immobilis]